MRQVQALTICLVVLAGCNPQPAGRTSPQSNAPAPKFIEVAATPPAVGMVAYRPSFHFGGKAPASAGTAFVVRTASGDKYLLTAAHLLDPAEWSQVKSVSLEDFRGAELGKSVGPAVYVGTGMDPARGVTEFDLAIFKLAPGDKTPPIKLAASYPNQNRLWVIGSEVTSRDGTQRLFEIKPKSTLGGATVLSDKVARFNLQAFSGGPIVDHQGQVVANVLGGNETSIIGSSVANLRRRLEEKGIQPE